MRYFYQIESGGALRRSAPVYYDPAHKTLPPIDTHVSIEEGSDYWALKINGDYSLVYDVDGLLIGDYEDGPADEYPRIEFYSEGCGGITSKMASLTQSGRLYAPAVNENDTLPFTGLNLYDALVITPAGITARKISEVWFVTDQGNYIVSGGLLIEALPQIPA